MFDFIDDGVITVTFNANQEMPALRTLMHKYATVPMSFADACLVRMSKLHQNSIILTTDSDFWIYRRYGQEAIPMITPFSP